MDNTQELIDHINLSIKARKEQEKAAKELRLKQEEEERKLQSEYIDELEKLFEQLEEYEYVIDTREWQDLCNLGECLIININGIYNGNYRSDNSAYTINDIYDWSYDYVSRLYQDRFKVLKVIHDTYV